MTDCIRAVETRVGGTCMTVWFAYIGKEILRDKRGIGRRFRSQDTALAAARKARADGEEQSR